MESEKANYPVQRMARLLGVSRSGFYAWRRRSSESSERAVVRAKLDAKVRLAHADSNGIYGAPRIQAALARKGTGVDRKTVASSMRRQGLEGISPRRFRPVAPIGEARVHSIPDLVARKWDTGALDVVWISDIT
jgi:putative transposase